MWQEAQPVVTPVWLNLAPVNVLVLLWQDSQGAAVATWLADLPLATLPSWQVAQPADVFGWTKEKFAVPWHCSQPAPLIGMCLVDMPFADVPLWQVAQPVVTPVWLNLAPLKVPVLLWQLSQGAVVTT